MKRFAQKHAETGDDLNILRRTANVRVMPDRCPLSVAIEALRTMESHQIDEHQNEATTTYVHDQGPNPTGLKLSRGVLGNLLCVIIKS